MKNYFFDFCGTLIKEQTHEQIKYFCKEKKLYFYFIKIFVPKKYKIKYDCFFLNFFNLHSEFTDWLVSNVSMTMSFSVLKKLILTDQNIKILTLADKKTIELYLLKLTGKSFDVLGSTFKYTIKPSDKAKIISNYQYSVFFTDSFIDLPAIEVSTEVVFSEFSSQRLIKYCKKNNYTYVGDYE